MEWQKYQKQLNATARIACAGLVGAFVLTGVAVAQQVHWNPPGDLDVGQRSMLELAFDNTEPRGRVPLPHIDGLPIVGPPSEATTISMVNGHSTASYTLSYPVRPDRKGQIQIPAFEVETSAGKQTVAAKTVDVGAPASGAPARSGRTGNDAVFARMATVEKKPYAGEVFDVDLLVGVKPGRRAELVGAPTWDKQTVIAEPWSDGQRAAASGGVRFHTRAVAPQAGPVDVGPVQQEVQVESTRPGRDSFFGRDFESLFGKDIDALMPSFLGHADTDDVTVASDTSRIDVKPLPQPAPQGFTGAVGTFTLDSKMVPAEPKAGEPVTWTLTLSGTGNWPGGVEIPARAIPADLRTVQPKQHKDFAVNALFTGSVSEDLVFVPMKPGAYELEPVRFVYFDPDKQQYETAIAHPPALHVGGTAVAGGPVSVLAAGTTTAGVPATAAPLSPQTRSPEGHLPRDPQHGTGGGVSPLPHKWVAGLVGLPFLVLAFYWLLLALRRADLTDPRRAQRQALVQIRMAIEAARHASDADARSGALLAWQKAAATVLGLDLAAPTATQLRTSANGAGITQSNEEWIALWKESDRAIYGKDSPFETTWCDQAAQVCTRIRRPRLNPLQIFLPRNLLPKAALAALALTLCASPVRADAVDDYVQGNFTAAHEQWLAQVQTAPTNWVARYNLGLVEGQQGQPGRGLGETAAAFVQQPRDASVRWNLDVFASRLPGLDRTLAQLMSGHGVAGLARTFAPATWQGLLIASAIALCWGMALILRRSYRDLPSVSRGWLPRGLLTSGAVIGLSAWLALPQYGLLADPGAAVVAEQTILHSVPTDAESPQQQKPIATGAVVVVEQEFLGWTKVARADGETGWIRHNDLVPLYAAPSEEKRQVTS